MKPYKPKSTVKSLRDSVDFQNLYLWSDCTQESECRRFSLETVTSTEGSGCGEERRYHSHAGLLLEPEVGNKNRIIVNMSHDGYSRSLCP